MNRSVNGIESFLKLVWALGQVLSLIWYIYIKFSELKSLVKNRGRNDEELIDTLSPRTPRPTSNPHQLPWCNKVNLQAPDTGRVCHGDSDKLEHNRHFFFIFHSWALMTASFEESRPRKMVYMTQDCKDQKQPAYMRTLTLPPPRFCFLHVLKRSLDGWIGQKVNIYITLR